MTMIMSDLPPDLVEEILSRVPATSLKRLRSTCKRWNALYKDNSFTEKHFRKAPKQSLVIAVKIPCGPVLEVSSVFLVNVDSLPSIEIEGALSLKDSHSKEVSVGISIIHCDGLLLCTTDMEDDRYVVWNPLTGETRWIHTDPGKDEYTMFALGHDNINKLAYKILRRYRRNHVDVFEIYELSSDSSWRVLDDVIQDWYIEQECMSLKGNAYWYSSDAKDDYFLTCFDFRRERFGRRICLPTFQGRGWICMSVFREEQLSVLHKCYDTSNMEIWLTSKIDTQAALWTKCFTVDLHNGFDKKEFGFLMGVDKKVVVYCNDAGAMTYTIEKYDIESSSVVSTLLLSWHPFIYRYVPSLVQIQQK